MTINELEISVQAGLEALRNVQLSPEASSAREILLPDGLSPVVELIQENGRRKRGSAASWNWNPQSDRIIISFRSITAANNEVTSPPDEPVSPPEIKPGSTLQISVTPISPQSMRTLPEPVGGVPDAVNPQEIVECCQALAAAEKSNRQFIALKWFRDDFLATVDYAWSKSSQRRQRVLSEAINIGRIEARKIPNPRAPQFPTTTIKLNRSIPTPGVPPRFQPVAIRGEAASTTLLRDRGSV